jgi:hypothetical protein
VQKRRVSCRDLADGALLFHCAAGGASIVGPDSASTVVRSVYVEANSYRCTFRRFVAPDGAAGASPAARGRCWAPPWLAPWAVASSRTLAPSRTLV